MKTSNFLFALLSLFFSNLVLCQTSEGLVAHYKFDGNYQDFSGNGHNATTANNTPFNAAENAAIILDEEDSFIEIPNSFLNNLTDFTVSVFVKLNGLNKNNNLISGANPYRQCDNNWLQLN